MRKIILFIMLILALISFSPVYAQVIVDEGSPNFQWIDALNDYRYWSNFSNSNLIGRGISGNYVYLTAEIIIAEALTSYDDVISVKAKHLTSGVEYHLNKDFWNLFGKISHEWWLQVRPLEWMWSGKWKFILVYKDSGGNTHKQTQIFKIGPITFIPKPDYISVSKPGLYEVSWSAIGNPYQNKPNCDYRVRVIDSNGDFLEDFKGDWQVGTEGEGTYDRKLNTVTFTIPKEYGAGTLLRLENRIYTENNLNSQTNRACYYIELPYFP